MLDVDASAVGVLGVLVTSQVAADAAQLRWHMLSLVRRLCLSWLWPPHQAPLWHLSCSSPSSGVSSAASGGSSERTLHSN